MSPPIHLRGTLFRDEVVRAKLSRLSGKVWVEPPPLSSAGALAAIGAASVFALILVRGEYAPRQTVAGYVAPSSGLVKVFAERGGKVEIVQVREGDSVKLGQSVAVVSAEQNYTDSAGHSIPASMLAELEGQVRRLSEDLVREEDTHKSNDLRLSTKIKSLRLELEARQDELEALDRQKVSAAGTLDKMQRLRAQGYVTALDLAAHEQQLLGLERQWHALSSQIAETESKIKDAEAEARQQPTQLRKRQATLRNQISEIRRQILGHEAGRGYAVTAPIAGTVTALQIEVGKPIDPERPLMAILSDRAAFEARLLVPSRAIGFVAPGQQVRLRYSAFPHQQYGAYSGQVREVSRVTLRPEELALGLPLTEPVYPVKVTLDAQAINARGRTQPLQAGMLLDADILLETRPLWTWFLEPLLAFRGRT